MVAERVCGVSTQGNKVRTSYQLLESNGSLQLRGALKNDLTVFGRVQFVYAQMEFVRSTKEKTDHFATNSVLAVSLCCEKKCEILLLYRSA